MTDAFLIMVMGMGGVFIFLIVLIFIMQALVAMLPPNESDARPVARAPVLASTAIPTALQDQTLIAVLQAAVHTYEADNQR